MRHIAGISDTSFVLSLTNVNAEDLWEGISVPSPVCCFRVMFELVNLVSFSVLLCHKYNEIFFQMHKCFFRIIVFHTKNFMGWLTCRKTCRIPVQFGASGHAEKTICRHEKKHKACGKKYKPCILKYKALILKYMPYNFRENRYLIFNNLQRR